MPQCHSSSAKPVRTCREEKAEIAFFLRQFFSETRFRATNAMPCCSNATYKNPPPQKKAASPGVGTCVRRPGASHKELDLWLTRPLPLPRTFLRYAFLPLTCDIQRMPNPHFPPSLPDPAIIYFPPLLIGASRCAAGLPNRRLCILRNFLQQAMFVVVRIGAYAKKGPLHRKAICHISAGSKFHFLQETEGRGIAACLPYGRRKKQPTQKK